MGLLTAVLLTVTIRSYDVYGVSVSDRQTAMRVASATLAAAGMATEWIDCGAGVAADRCRAVDRSAIIVRIGRAPGGPGGRDALGTAAVDTAAGEGSLATLYADRVFAHASAAGADFGTLLGRAAAHEIGHLLIGTTGHARHGVMRARWSRADLQRRFTRDWRFSAEEAQQMRGHLAARTHAGPATRESLVAVLSGQEGR